MIAEGDLALSRQMTTLNAEFGDFKSGVTDQIEVISNDVSAQAQALLSLTAEVEGKADASAVQLLTSRVEETEFGITALGQSIDQINVSLTGKADASALTALEGTVSTLDGKVTANANAITNVSAQVAGKAEASVVQQLSATVETTNGVVSAINAQYFLAVEANGLIGGMKIGNNGQRVDFAVQADRFSITPPNSSGQRFEYSNGNIRAYHNNGNLCFRAGTW